ncbi:unnamed protein product [Dicrocoelium dendriticum]|nr:unnamed protein product [Dicrocoelium dendriticum]
MVRCASASEMCTSLNDFKALYEHICFMQRVVPSRIVLRSIKNGFFKLALDQIKLSDLKPVLYCLSLDNTLDCISIFLTKAGVQPAGGTKCCRRNSHLPACSAKAALIQTLCPTLHSILRFSNSLTLLELQNLPLSATSISALCKGIAKSTSLKHLSFKDSNIGDSGLLDVCCAIRRTPKLSTINLAGCRISSRGVESLVELLRFQAMQRHNLAWQQSLRYQHPVMDQFGGIRRITLNDNPEISDTGSTCLAEAMQDDLWVKAIDLQACEISDKSAMTWLRILIGDNRKALTLGEELTDHQINLGNRSLEVLDLRRNPTIDSGLLRLVTERTLINSEGKRTEYKWLNVGSRSFKRRDSEPFVHSWPAVVGVDHQRQVPRCPVAKCRTSAAYKLPAETNHGKNECHVRNVQNAMSLKHFCYHQHQITRGTSRVAKMSTTARQVRMDGRKRSVVYSVHK